MKLAKSSRPLPALRTLNPRIERGRRNPPAPVLTRALPKIPYPDHCRTSPDDNRDLSHWPAGEDRVQDEGNGDQHKRYRTDQGRCAPARAREIEKPEEHRQAPVKRRFPGGVANHRRDDMAMGIE